MLKKCLFYLLFTLVIFSCNKDDNKSTSDYSKGTFIVNEGLFNSGTGTITYLDENEKIDDIFAQQNPGLVLGNIANSMIKYDKKYFIAVNNGAKIVVVNEEDFKYMGEIKLDLPRYFVKANDKLYVTSWSSDFSSGFINLIDSKTLSISKSTPVNGLVEKMIAKDNFIYTTVSTSEWDELNHHVIQYDIQKDVIIGNIEVGDNSNDLVLDNNGDIWVICSGFYNYTDPNLNTDGSLHKLEDNKSVFSKKLKNGVNKLVINSSKKTLYFLSDTQVLEFDLKQPNNEPKEIYNGIFYSLGFNPENKNLYLLNAKDFQQNGEATILNTENKPVSAVKTGIIPTFIYFSN